MNELTAPTRAHNTQWTRRALQLVDSAARSNQITANDILLPGRARGLALDLRRRVMAQLAAEGCSSTRLGKLFDLHHTTVLYHLGRLNRPDRRRPSAHVETAQAVNG